MCFLFQGAFLSSMLMIGGVGFCRGWNPTQLCRDYFNWCMISSMILVPKLKHCLWRDGRDCPQARSPSNSAGSGSSWYYQRFHEQVPSLKLTANAPESWWLEDEFPFGALFLFWGANFAVNFRECNFDISQLIHQISSITGRCWAIATQVWMLLCVCVASWEAANLLRTILQGIWHGWHIKMQWGLDKAPALQQNSLCQGDVCNKIYTKTKDKHVYRSTVYLQKR